MQDNLKSAIGILGGTGPDATIDIQKKLINIMKRVCSVKQDQDHIRVIVDNNPHIPDRNNALLQNEESPFEYYMEGIKQLVSFGANVIIIPCNTAHAYFEEIQGRSPVKIINMIEVVAIYLAKHYANVKAFGLLSTPATALLGLYQTYLNRYDQEALCPNTKALGRVHHAIKLIKKSFGSDDQASIREAKQILNDEIKRFRAKNISHIILGCTELPLLFEEKYFENSCLIDPNYIVANAAIEYYLTTKYEVK